MTNEKREIIKHLNDGGPWWGGNVSLRRTISRALLSDSVSLSNVTVE